MYRYTSFEVLRDLSEKGIHLCGTIKANRNGLPRDGYIKSKDKAARGSFAIQEAMLELPNGKTKDVFLYSWQDKKPVLVLSTFQTGIDIVKRNTKNKRTGEFEVQHIERPQVIGTYLKI